MCVCVETLYVCVYGNTHVFPYTHMTTHCLAETKVANGFKALYLPNSSVTKVFVSYDLVRI